MKANLTNKQRQALEHVERARSAGMRLSDYARAHGVGIRSMSYTLIAAWLRLWLGIVLSVLMLCATQAVADGSQVVQPPSETAADAADLTNQADELLAAGRFGEAEPRRGQVAQ